MGIYSSLQKKEEDKRKAEMKTIITIIKDFFSTPIKVEEKRRKIRNNGIVLFSLVVTSVAIKYFLVGASAVEFSLMGTVGIVSMSLIAFSIYGKDEWIILYFGEE